MFQYSYVYILLSVLYSCNVLGATEEGFGDVASNIYGPVSLIIQLVRATSIICGSGLILSGILKFIDHRRNPAAVRMSTVVFMFIFGFSLIAIAFIPLN